MLFLWGFLIGGLAGVFIMALVAVNKNETPITPNPLVRSAGGVATRERFSDTWQIIVRAVTQTVERF